MYRMTSASRTGHGTVFNGNARAGDPVVADIKTASRD